MQLPSLSQEIIEETSGCTKGEGHGTVGWLTTPRCHDMQEIPEAASERARLRNLLSKAVLAGEAAASLETPLERHLLQGLAYTIGSALSHDPPTDEECLIAYVAPNKAGLTAGARAWSKHAHRFYGVTFPKDREGSVEADIPTSVTDARSSGWWGTPSGSVARINAGALSLLKKVTGNATWRNLHWLPHQVLVYEIRIEEGYGMRWSQSWDENAPEHFKPWVFRGFVEPAIPKQLMDEVTLECSGPEGAGRAE